MKPSNETVFWVIEHIVVLIDLNCSVGRRSAINLIIIFVVVISQFNLTESEKKKRCEKSNHMKKKSTKLTETHFAVIG